MVHEETKFWPHGVTVFGGWISMERSFWPSMRNGLELLSLSSESAARSTTLDCTPETVTEPDQRPLVSLTIWGETAKVWFRAKGRLKLECTFPGLGEAKIQSRLELRS